MKSIILLFAAIAVSVASADSEPKFKKVKFKGNPILKLTGGKILRPGAKQGEVAFFNLQNAIPSDAFSVFAKHIGTMLHIKSDVKTINVKEGFNEYKKVFKESGAQFAVFIIDNPLSEDSMIVYPENRYSVVNISPLRANGGEGVFLTERAKKQVARAFFYVAGAASTAVDGNLMSAFPSLQDLDKIPSDAIPVEVIGRVGEYLPRMGCETKTFTTYRKACQEGWAPAPTNEYQKAIWDKVHAMPTAPIKIKPETKKVRE